MGTSAPPSHGLKVALLGLLRTHFSLERQITATSPECLSERLVLQFRRSQLKASLSWLDICEGTLPTHAAQVSS